MSTNSAGRKRHPLGVLHRHGGIIAAALVVVICATGILLNHSGSLKLDKTHVNDRWLLDWYGMHIPSIHSFQAGDNYVSQSGSTVLLNAIPVSGRYQPLVGVVAAGQFIVAATSDQLLLLTDAGSVVETLQAVHGIPAAINQIGITATETQQRIWLRSGDKLWESDTELMNWSTYPAQPPVIRWAQPVALPAHLAEAIAATQLGDGLSLERIILDLHSGRIFGQAGPLLADAVAALFIVLALSGIWMWFRARNRAT